MYTRSRDTQQKEDPRIRRTEAQKLRKDEKFVEKKEAEQRRIAATEAAKKALEKTTKKKVSSKVGYYIVFGLVTFVTIYVIAMMVINSTPNLTRAPAIDLVKIEEHNASSKWKQGPNIFFEGLSLQDAKNTLGSNFSNEKHVPNCPMLVDDDPMPLNFDARDEWKSCISPVVNQGQTCSSHAVVVAQAIAERKCIHSEDKKLTALSAQNLLSCDTKNKGCSIGYLNSSLEFAKQTGLVEESCFPYTGETTKTKCLNKCEDGQVTKLGSYCMVYNPENIKKEILNYGPVVSVTIINVDFLNYKSGVYKPLPETPKFQGFHAVKVVGWGIDKTDITPTGEYQEYWIIQNSWGSDWGENGYARVASNTGLFFERFAYSFELDRQRAPVSLEEKGKEDNIDLDEIEQNKRKAAEDAILREERENNEKVDSVKEAAAEETNEEAEAVERETQTLNEEVDVEENNKNAEAVEDEVEETKVVTEEN